MNIPKMDEATGRAINDEALKYAKIFVQEDRLKTHQLRNVFSAVEKIRTDYKIILRKDKDTRRQELEDLTTPLILLIPKIAYAAGRQKSVRYHFFEFVEKAINAVVDSKDKEVGFRNFFSLMESVVGYHKYLENK